LRKALPALRREVLRDALRREGLILISSIAMNRRVSTVDLAGAEARMLRRGVGDGAGLDVSPLALGGGMGMWRRALPRALLEAVRTTLQDDVAGRRCGTTLQDDVAHERRTGRTDPVSFETADKNKDGRINRTEADDVPGLDFSAADTNEDASLTRAEFRVALADSLSRS
jgi:hypothetical protein